MRKQLASIASIAIMVLFVSCKANKSISFLKECAEFRNSAADNFCISTPTEIKENLPSKDRIYYLGTDSVFHFFKYHYRTAFFSSDKTANWAVMAFKIPKADYILPIQKKIFRERNTQEDATGLMLAEL